MNGELAAIGDIRADRACCISGQRFSPATGHWQPLPSLGDCICGTVVCELGTGLAFRVVGDETHVLVAGCPEGSSRPDAKYQSKSSSNKTSYAGENSLLCPSASVAVATQGIAFAPGGSDKVIVRGCCASAEE
jgi:hypothetical protein